MSKLGGAKYEAELPLGGAVSPRSVPNGAAPGGGMPKGEPVAPASARTHDKEASLIHHARGAARSADGQIVALYQDRLFNALLRMVGEPEEARELTQETFTRGLEKIETFRGDSSPYTWLFRIGMNLAISNLRRWQRARVFSLDAGPRRANGSSRRDNQAAALVDRITTPKSDSPPEAAERSER